MRDMIRKAMRKTSYQTSFFDHLRTRVGLWSHGMAPGFGLASLRAQSSTPPGGGPPPGGGSGVTVEDDSSDSARQTPSLSFPNSLATPR